MRRAPDVPAGSEMTTKIIVEASGPEQQLELTAAIVRQHLALAYGDRVSEPSDLAPPNVWYAQVQGSDLEFEINAENDPAVLHWVMGGDGITQLPLPASRQAIEAFVDDALWSMSPEYREIDERDDPDHIPRPEGWTGSMLGQG